MDTPAAGTRKDPAPFALHDIPKEFGEDGGEFYRHYDALAEELDDNMVNKLKDQLDGLLLFAGLFAGVNSTFLALTLPLLSASPADDTNALLRENNAILFQLASNRNDSFPIASPLPSESFSVSGRVLTVNVLFSISLTLALMSSLFAILGRQWLVEYRNSTGSGADDQRRERISCYLGARGWGLEWLLGDLLPTLLQIGLILFGISLAIYVSTLNSTVAKIDFPPEIPLLVRSRKRREVAPTTLQVEAIARVISYSDDRPTLAHAISNLLSVEDGRVLQRLASNDQFCRSLSYLCRTPYTETLHSQDPDKTELALAENWWYRAAMARIAFSASWNFVDGLFTGTSMRRSFGMGDRHGLTIPSDLIKASPPTLINDCLGYVALLAAKDRGSRPILGRTVIAAFEGLIDSSWERIAAIVTCMNVSCTMNMWGNSAVVRAFEGEPSAVLRDIGRVLRKCTDPGCGAHIPFYEYLVDTFKFIGKAAIDSSGQSTMEINLIARLLRLSELFLRTEECPAEFLPVARGLRKDLLSALRSKYEGNADAYYHQLDFGLIWTVESLSSLFWSLTAVRDRFTSSLEGDNLPMLHLFRPQIYLNDDDLELAFLFRPAIYLNDNDLELASLFRPVLQCLDELRLENW
ncbi:hypothetical protein FRC04_006579 [Tulasnella sp. 424]|nr:hypothetical protein FRC04_006579 [Tulasnella sp. 424]